MSLSIHSVSVGVMTRMLNNLSTVLDLAVAHAEANGIDPSRYAEARLAPDMRPLTAQIQLASDSAKGAGARLSGIEAPSFADNETTFPEMQERITKTIAFLAGVDRAAVDASADRTVEVKTRSSTRSFRGADYLEQFALPNFFFHVSIAYAILRAEGVPLGKLDFLGARPAPEPAALPDQVEASTPRFSQFG
jgi:uncharacterized protein